MTLFEKTIFQRSKIHEKQLKFICQQIPTPLPSTVKYVNGVYEYVFQPETLTEDLLTYTTDSKCCFAEFIETIRANLKLKGYSELNCSTHFLPNFWQFDNLKLPFYHADRGERDTFYLDANSSFDTYPNQDTCSQDFFVPYKLDEKYVDQLSLRTHTTGVMFMHRKNNPASHVFSIGRVFRRQREDSTHKIEFHQLQINIVGEEMDIEKMKYQVLEIFSAIGLAGNEIKFSRTYYPYTEPSVQIDALIDGKWVELAGGGLFHKNVCNKIGVNSAIGFGLGLQRLFMLQKKLNTLDLNEI